MTREPLLRGMLAARLLLCDLVRVCAVAVVPMGMVHRDRAGMRRWYGPSLTSGTAPGLGFHCLRRDYVGWFLMNIGGSD